MRQITGKIDSVRLVRNTNCALKVARKLNLKRLGRESRAAIAGEKKMVKQV